MRPLEKSRLLNRGNGLRMVIVSTLFLIIWAEAAYACSCMGRPSTCEAHSDGQTIFYGQATSIQEDRGPEGIGGKGGELWGYVTRFSVKEAFQGVSTKEFDVFSGPDTCGIKFKIGENYLVYGFPMNRYTNNQSVLPNLIGTNICTRTRPQNYAQTDLELLRVLINGKVESRVYGSVGYTWEKLEMPGEPDSFPTKPMMNVRVTAVGTDVRAETQTDSEGHFYFPNLKPGKYKIMHTLPENYVPHRYYGSVREIEVPSGCFDREVIFRDSPDTQISGKVRRLGGEPVGMKIAVTLINANDLKKPTASIPSLRIFTRPNGDFKFEGVLPGRYVLGVSIVGAPDVHTPFPRTYFPSGADPAQAKVIEVLNGQKLSGQDLQLAAELETVEIQGAVLDESGQSAENVSISIYDIEYSKRFSYSLSTMTDKSGRFVARLLKSRRYLVRASKPIGRFGDERFYSSEFEVNADDPPMEIKLLLNQRGVLK